MAATHNPLLIAILARLKDATEPLSEYQLIKYLESQQCFDLSSATANLALFQRYFLVMNALYQLQGSLLTEGYYLHISPLAIYLERRDLESRDLQTRDLQASSASASQALIAEHKDRALADYYLDLSQLEMTDESQVEAMLAGFWQAFVSEDRQLAAYQTLGLEIDASWPMVQRSYRRLVADTHPDRGGDSAAFMAIREAYELLLQRQVRS